MMGTSSSEGDGDVWAESSHGTKRDDLALGRTLLARARHDALAFDRTRRCPRGRLGFELRHHDGNYQIVFISSLTGDALPFEDNLTLDDVQRWVDENAVDDGH